MRYFIFGFAIALLSLSAHAQVNRARAPMLVTSGGQQVNAPSASANTAPTSTVTNQHIDALPMPTNFPEWAITKAGENTAGQGPGSISAAPSNPANAPAGKVPANPATAGVPAVSASPASPVDKLWPRDTIEIFMPSCTGFHPELVTACTCVITRLMLTMGHDEFLTKSEAGTIEQDARLQTIRRECVGTPQRRQ